MTKFFLILIVYSSTLFAADQPNDKQNTFNNIKNILNNIGKFKDKGEDWLTTIDEHRGDYCSLIKTQKKSVQGVLDLDTAHWVRLKDLISTDETNTELARLELTKNYKSCNFTFNCTKPKCVVIDSKETVTIKAAKRPVDFLLFAPIQCQGIVNLLRAFNHLIQLCGGKSTIVDKTIPQDDPFANPIYDKNDDKTEIKKLDTKEINRQAMTEWLKNNNVPAAIKLFKLSCEEGRDSNDCWNLGYVVKNVQNNFPDSIQWYRKSCELGNDDGCVVANSLSKSLNDPKDSKKMVDIKKMGNEYRNAGNIMEANRMFTLACDTGWNSDACWNLAELNRAYFKDMETAKVWYARACELGDQEACIEENKYREK